MISPADATDSWRDAPLAEVCQVIGSTMLRADVPNLSHDATPETLGQITLRPHQIDAVERISSAIEMHRGALLADTVGLGKTYVALALARGFEQVDILTPAALLPMWRSALAAAGVQHAHLHSLHRFSRASSAPPRNRTRTARPALVIIDEAHHLRTRNTNRFRQVAEFCVNAHVLLISATPLHNRPRELRTLLSLFLGARADALDAHMLASCVIRRSSTHVEQPLPTVRDHNPINVPANVPVLEAILALAPPLPSHDGAAAGALIRLGLLRAWCSSDAALTDTLRRRQLRGEAMLHSLAHGRHPTQRELQSWIVGSDSVQLGFPELLVDAGAADSSSLITTLTTHLDSLQSLLQLHTRTSHTDATRVAHLRAMLGTSATDAPPNAAPQLSNSARSDTAPAEGSHVIAFSQFASTVRALHRALGDIAGVASLTSSGGLIASGTIPREQVIARFAPRSNGKPPPPPHERIRLLLATDLLAEGVNLQDANTVVHLDLPWTDALRQQRVGRVVRMKSPHTEVHVHTFAPPVGSERAIALSEALARKAGFHREWIGNDAAPPHDTRQSAAEASTELRTILQSWAASDESRPRTGATLPSVLVTTVRADVCGFIALAELGGEASLFAQEIPASALRSAPTALRGDALHATWLREPACALPSLELRNVLPLLRRVASHRAAELLGDIVEVHPSIARHRRFAMQQMMRVFAMRASELISGPASRSVSPVQERATRALASRIAQVPSTARALHRSALVHAERQIAAATSAGAEDHIASWLTNARDAPFADWIQAVPVLAAERTDDDPVAAPALNAPGRIIALVLLSALHP